MEVPQQPVLHVEARVNSNSDGIIIRTDLVLLLSNSPQIPSRAVELIAAD
jgi:hypothetical protein